MPILETTSRWAEADTIDEHRDWPRGATWTTDEYERPATDRFGDLASATPKLQPWLRSAAQTLTKFATYSYNWNGYDERPITPRSINRAIAVLRMLAVSDSPSPSAIVPLANGGLQLEWGDGGDVTVEVSPSGDAEGYHVDKDATWQLREGADFSQLIRYISQHA